MPHSTTDDGCRLWTEARGDGPPVVLVHGGPGWWDTFGDLSLPGFTLHRWDQRGAGRSDPRGPYTLTRFVADLETIRHNTGHEQVMILGHSWGASLALEYAVTHQHHLTHLILVSSTGLDGPPPSYRQQVAERLAAEPSDDPWLARIATNFHHRPTAMSNARHLNTPRFTPNPNAAEALLADLHAIPNRATSYSRITVPTLLIHGAEDLRPPFVTDTLLKVLPNAERTVLPEVAHYPWLEAPDEFRETVRDFLLR